MRLQLLLLLPLLWLRCQANEVNLFPKVHEDYDEDPEDYSGGFDANAEANSYVGDENPPIAVEEEHSPSRAKTESSRDSGRAVPMEEEEGYEEYEQMVQLWEDLPKYRREEFVKKRFHEQSQGRHFKT